MKIKGHEFGKNKPLICVPVVERTEAAIIECIGQMTAAKVEMIEWRMDWYEKVEDMQAVAGLLRKLAPYLTETVFLCTFRSKPQGGERAIEEETYIALNKLVAESKVADLIDVEFYELSKPREVIRCLQNMEAGVVCSNHNFFHTPALEELERQLEEMGDAGADFSKLAVMPEKETDVLRLMEAVIRTKEKHPDRHYIAMSMAQTGVITRMLGQWFHSEVTFAAFGKASAPGQVEYVRLKNLLEQLSESI